MAILFEFLMRLSFGLAVAMAITSPRQVRAGFYRNHLYVTLGLSLLAALVALGEQASWAGGLAAAAALFSYAGSVCWLYERPRAGLAVIIVLAVISLAAALCGTPQLGSLTGTLSLLERGLWWLTPPTSGLLLGLTLGAMLLGHWYLNSPTMQLAPLRKLLGWMVLAILLRALVCGWGLWGALTGTDPLPGGELWFLVLRWLTGLVAPLLMAWMVQRTLLIPNTQSATGILYVAAVMVFTGELTSQLLSSGAPYPF